MLDKPRDRKPGHFEICREMAKRNMDIRMSLLENVTNISYSKRTKGTTISIAAEMDTKERCAVILNNEAKEQIKENAYLAYNLNQLAERIRGKE